MTTRCLAVTSSDCQTTSGHNAGD